MEAEKPIRMGQRGLIVIPAHIRKHFKLEEGSLLIVEEKKDGIFLLPAVVLPSKIDFKE